MSPLPPSGRRTLRRTALISHKVPDPFISLILVLILLLLVGVPYLGFEAQLDEFQYVFVELRPLVEHVPIDD